VSVPLSATSLPRTRSPLLRHVSVFGHRIRVAVWPGSERRPPLLLFNGIGANLELLSPVANGLPDVEVVAFDAPGVGGSGPALHPYRPWQYAVLATRVLDALGYRCKVDVLGVSWGGAMAQQLAFQARGRVRRLVLAATSAGMFMVPGHPRVLCKLAGPKRYVDAKYLASHFETLYGDGADDDDHAARIKPPTPAGYWFQLLAGAGWTSVPFLPLIPHETLVLAGRRDQIVPPVNGRILARLIPRAQLRIVDGGHLFLVSRATQVMPTIDEFLGRSVADPPRPGAPE
jgi:poly(3-hydroxyalkanoate) depolymerase